MSTMTKVKRLLGVAKEKRKVDQDDIAFLIALQAELQTQDNDYQANPRFWMVGQYEWQPTGADWADDTHYLDSNFGVIYESFEKFRESVFNNSDYEEKERKQIEATANFDNFIEVMEELGYDTGYYEEIPVKRVHVIKDKSMFLTKRECAEHIESNSYHYNETAHTYALTAWRSPQVEQLLEILTNVDFSKIKKQPKPKEKKEDENK